MCESLRLATSWNGDLPLIAERLRRTVEPRWFTDGLLLRRVMWATRLASYASAAALGAKRRTL